MQKIIFLSGAVLPQTGGELYNYKMAQSLEASDLEQEFISLHNYRHYLRLAKLPILGDLLVTVILAVALYRHRGLLVEDHYFSRYLLLTNFIQKYIRNQKIIILVHLFYQYDSAETFSLKRFIYRWLERLHLSFADEIVVTSQYSRREAISLGIDAKKIHVFHPGLDREFRYLSPSEYGDKEKKILCVGNFIPRKGIRYLIEAFAQAKRDFKLHLVGNAKESAVYYRQLLKQVKELGLEADVYFHQGVDREKIDYLYATAEVFVLPSLKETFGIVLIEAMYYRLPIITTNTSAMPDLVTDGENGLLVPPKDTAAIAWALTTLIDDPLLRRRMGEDGHQKIKDSYRWEHTSACFLSLVQTVNAHRTPLEPC